MVTSELCCCLFLGCANSESWMNFLGASAEMALRTFKIMVWQTLAAEFLLKEPFFAFSSIPFLLLAEANAVACRTEWEISYLCHCFPLSHTLPQMLEGVLGHVALVGISFKCLWSCCTAGIRLPQPAGSSETWMQSRSRLVWPLIKYLLVARWGFLRESPVADFF